MAETERITSPANPLVRDAARLREADVRRDTGLTLVDGRREIARAAAAGIEFVRVFVDGDAAHDADRESLLGRLAAAGARAVILARRPFEKIAFGSRNEGIVGVVRFAARSLDSFAVVADRPVLVVEAVEKPGNLGAILRTADAAGVAGVIACGPGTDPANPAVIRASLGTVFSLPLAVATTDAAIEWCLRLRRRLIMAAPDGDRLWHEARLAGATAIVLGSESHGLSAAWHAPAVRAAGETVRIPMCGVADSLNVSVAAAVLAYEAVRQSAPAHAPGDP